jgi:hypothetical protein
MEYEGPTQDDLDNVAALNGAWLDYLARDPERMPQLSSAARERLAATPFLLFTFREQDEAWWQSLLDGSRQRDLLAAQPAVTEQLLTLQSMGLAFLWQLSRRNPYVARIVSGASLAWCERIVEITLVEMLEPAARCQILAPRFKLDSHEFQRLLRRGASALRLTREAAQIAALQSLLTQADAVDYARLPAAACRVTVPSRKIADKL